MTGLANPPHDIACNTLPCSFTRMGPPPQLARPVVIRPVEGDRGHREAPKSFLGLLGQPLACLLPEHAFPVQLSGPATPSHKLALSQRPQGPGLRLRISCVAPGNYPKHRITD